MPPKKRAPNAEIKITPEIVVVEESGPSKPKRTKKEKQETEGAPTISKRIITKRGVQSKIPKEEEKQEPAKKRGKAKVAEEKDKPLTADAPKKTGKKAEETELKNKKEAPKKTGKKAEDTDLKEKKDTKTTKRKDTKIKEIKEIKSAKITKEEAPTPSEVTATKTNKIVTDWKSITFDCSKKNKEGNLPNFKITSWNIDGVRAWVKKDGLKILEYDSPDILCLQETKCSDDKLPEELTELEGYHKFWCGSNKSGYAGVGLFSKENPIKVTYGIGNQEQDIDGRCLTAEYADFYLVNVYVPNSGKKLVTLEKRLEWNELFKDFIKNLDRKKPVIICGDLNVAHNEIDLTNPKTNKRNAGFTDEEREGMTELLQEGFIDSFRCLYPDQTEVYTFWTYLSNARKRNVGWRLDYFVLSSELQNKLCDCVVLDEVYGSDHCPITLFINI